jgi:hypothetical protein
MDKPRFTVFEGGEAKDVDRPLTEEERWNKEVYEDCLKTLRETLARLKDPTQPRVLGLTICMVYEDQSIGTRHSKTSMFPAMVGAMSLGQYERMSAGADRSHDVEPPELTEDDE